MALYTKGWKMTIFNIVAYIFLFMISTYFTYAFFIHVTN